MHTQMTSTKVGRRSFGTFELTSPATRAASVGSALRRKVDCFRINGAQNQPEL
jgi:hypothetical protein